MDNIEILNMTLDDFETIKDVLNTDFDDFWNSSILKSELENPNSKYIVAKVFNDIVGFAGIWKAVDDIHITNIVVKKSFRRKGIGSKLLIKLIEIAKNNNVDSITLEVNESNKVAQNLYFKYGFKNVGIRKKYYNNIENAIIMTKELK